MIQTLLKKKKSKELNENLNYFLQYINHENLL